MALVGPKTTLVDNLYVAQAPATLAAAAGLPLDLYSLARLVQSEWGSGPLAGRIAIAEAARNRAASVGKSVTAMLAHHDGRYGRQTGGWASTSQDPTPGAVEAAKSAYGGSNLAGGAIRFFDGKSQDGGVQAGKALTYDASGIVSKWGAEGLEWIKDAPIYTQYGVDPYRLMVFRKTSSPDIASALAAIVRGRGGAIAAGGAGILLLGLGIWFLLRRR